MNKQEKFKQLDHSPIVHRFVLLCYIILCLIVMLCYVRFCLIVLSEQLELQAYQQSKSNDDQLQ